MVRKLNMYMVHYTSLSSVLAVETVRISRSRTEGVTWWFLKERPSRVDDKPEGDAESAGGGVVDGVVAVRGGGVQRRGHPRCGEDVGVDRLPAAATPPL